MMNRGFGEMSTWQVIGRWSELLDGFSSTQQDKRDGSTWEGQRIWSIVGMEP